MNELNDIAQGCASPTTTACKELLARLIRHQDFPATGARLWQKHGKLRVYYRSSRGVSLFSDWSDGWSARCYIEDCGQHANWYAAQRKEHLASISAAHMLLIGFAHAVEDDPSATYSPATTAEFSAAAGQVRGLRFPRIFEAEKPIAEQ